MLVVLLSSSFTSLSEANEQKNIDYSFDLANNSIISDEVGSNALSYTYDYAWNLTKILGSSSNGVTSGDVDGDGKIELIFTSLGDVRLYNPYNRSLQTIFSASLWTRDVAAADTDNDGRAEIVLVNDLLEVVLIDWTPGGWTNTTIQASSSTPQIIEPCDIDDNERVDLVVGTASGIYILNNTESGWIYSWVYSCSVNDLLCGDVDGDGTIEIVAANYATNATELFKKVDGTWSKQIIMSSDCQVRSISGDNIVGDEKIEILSTVENGSVLLSNLIASNWESSIIWAISVSDWNLPSYHETGSVIPYASCMGDVNADGKIDAIVRVGLNTAPSSGRLYLLQNWASEWNATYVGPVATWWGSSILALNLDDDNWLEIASATSGLDIFDAVPGTTIVGDTIINGEESLAFTNQDGSLLNVVGSIIVEDDAQLSITEITVNIDPGLNSKANLTARHRGSLTIADNAKMNSLDLINVNYSPIIQAYDNSIMNLSMTTGTAWYIQSYDNASIHIKNIFTSGSVVALNSSRITLVDSYVGQAAIFPNATLHAINSTITYPYFGAFTYGVTLIENNTISGDWNLGTLINEGSTIGIESLYNLQAFNASVLISNSSVYNTANEITGIYVVALTLHGNSSAVIRNSNSTTNSYVSILDNSTLYASNTTLINSLNQSQQWTIFGNQFGVIDSSGLNYWAYSLDVNVIDQNDHTLIGGILYAFNATDQPPIHSPQYFATTNENGNAALYLPVDETYELTVYYDGLWYETNVTSLTLIDDITIVVKIGSVIITDHVFDVTVGDTTIPVAIASNSSISEFDFNKISQQLSFNVTGPTGTTGFCNISIPEELLWGDFSVYLNGEPLVEDVDYTRTYNGTHNIFYITYNHSSHMIEITGTDVIPEYSSWLLSSLLLVATLVIVINKKRLFLSSP